MIPADIKKLVERYCMGLEPTEAQENEIMDAVIAANLDADNRREVVSYMAELMAGPTLEQKAAAEAEAKRKAAEEARRKAAEEAEKKARAEEEARKKAAAEAEAKRKAAEEAKRKAAEEAAKKAKAEEKARIAAEKKAREEELREIERRKREAKNRKQIRATSIVAYSVLGLAFLTFLSIQVFDLSSCSSFWNFFFMAVALGLSVFWFRDVRVTPNNDQSEYLALNSALVCVSVICVFVLPILYIMDVGYSEDISLWLLIPSEIILLQRAFLLVRGFSATKYSKSCLSDTIYCLSLYVLPILQGTGTIDWSNWIVVPVSLLTSCIVWLILSKNVDGKAPKSISRFCKVSGLVTIIAILFLVTKCSISQSDRHNSGEQTRINDEIPKGVDDVTLDAAGDSDENGSSDSVENSTQWREKYDYVYSQDPRTGWHEVKKNGKTGYVDKNGKEVIPCKYDYIYSPDSETGWMKVKIGEKKGYLDKNGKEIIPCKYDYIYSPDSETGWMKVKIGEKKGYLDKNGKEIIPCKYDFIYSPDSKNGWMKVEIGNKKGIISVEGKVLLPVEYDYIGSPSSDGTVLVEKGNKAGRIDRNGKFIVPLQ